MLIIRIIIFILPVLIIPLFAGCRGMGSQNFTAFAPTQANELAASSRVVLDVRCTNVCAYADYNLWENMQMLAPRAKYWKYDMSFQVERIVQGEFDGHSLSARWFHDLAPEQSHTLGLASFLAPETNNFSGPGGFAFTNGMPLRIGFDSCSKPHLQNLKVMIRCADKPSRQSPTHS